MRDFESLPSEEWLPVVLDFSSGATEFEALVHKLALSLGAQMFCKAFCRRSVRTAMSSSVSKGRPLSMTLAILAKQ